MSDSARPGARFRGTVVPYVTRWSEEKPLSATVISVRGRIAYADETLGERDEHGVLWQRVPLRPGRGRPDFGVVHALRQRRAVRKLLCQVCAGPADQNEAGTLWLLPDRRDWPDWPENMGCTEPPICLSCARTAIGSCPALREGYVAFRVGESPVSGVSGAYYEPGGLFPRFVGTDLVAFEDPRIRWTCAGHLVRELHNCTMVDLSGEAPEQRR
jgi:hypothetical protein